MQKSPIMLLITVIIKDSNTTLLISKVTKLEHKMLFISITKFLIILINNVDCNNKIQFRYTHSLKYFIFNHDNVE